MTKQPMQASGKGRKDEVRANDGVEVPASGKKGSESNGGAYPNQAAGSGFNGGQSRKEYHGTGQLGSQKTGENANAPSRHDDEA